MIRHLSSSCSLGDHGELFGIHLLEISTAWGPVWYTGLDGRNETKWPTFRARSILASAHGLVTGLCCARASHKHGTVVDSRWLIDVAGSRHTSLPLTHTRPERVAAELSRRERRRWRRPACGGGKRGLPLTKEFSTGILRLRSLTPTYGECIQHLSRLVHSLEPEGARKQASSLRNRRIAPCAPRIALSPEISLLVSYRRRLLGFILLRAELVALLCS